MFLFYFVAVTFCVTFCVTSCFLLAGLCVDWLPHPDAFHLCVTGFTWLFPFVSSSLTLLLFHIEFSVFIILVFNLKNKQTNKHIYLTKTELWTRTKVRRFALLNVCIVLCLEKSRRHNTGNRSALCCCWSKQKWVVKDSPSGGCWTSQTWPWFLFGIKPAVQLSDDATMCIKCAMSRCPLVQTWTLWRLVFSTFIKNVTPA